MSTVLAIAAGTALAHIDPDPAAIEAGQPATVAFGVEHGCAGSPTVAMDFKIPAGVTDAKPEDKAGWTTTTEGDVVRFSDGNLDAETPDTFSISFTAPNEAGIITFPVVQTCATGETAWIEIAAEGEAEPEHPAPAIKVTDGPPSSADLVPADDEEEEEASTETSGAAVTASSVSSSDSDDSSSTGVVIVIVVAAVVVVGGVAFYATRRRGQRSA